MHEQLLDQHLGHLHHVESQKSCADLSAKHPRRIFQVEQRQPRRLSWRRQHKPDRQHHELIRRFRKPQFQKHHV